MQVLGGIVTPSFSKLRPSYLEGPGKQSTYPHQLTRPSPFHFGSEYNPSFPSILHHDKGESEN